MASALLGCMFSCEPGSAKGIWPALGLTHRVSQPGLQVTATAHLGAGSGGCLGEADPPSMARLGGTLLFPPAWPPWTGVLSKAWGETGVSWGSICPAAPCRGELPSHSHFLLPLCAPSLAPFPLLLSSFHFFLAISVSVLSAPAKL